MVDQKKAPGLSLPTPNNKPSIAMSPMDQVTRVSPRRERSAGHSNDLLVVFIIFKVIK
jgi:hypothetical protein